MPPRRVAILPSPPISPAKRPPGLEHREHARGDRVGIEHPVQRRVGESGVELAEAARPGPRGRAPGRRRRTRRPRAPRAASTIASEASRPITRAPDADDLLRSARRRRSRGRGSARPAAARAARAPPRPAPARRRRWSHSRLGDQREAGIDVLTGCPRRPCRRPRPSARRARTGRTAAAGRTSPRLPDRC